MAQPPSLKRLKAEDFAEAPEWFRERFLPVFNEFATSTAHALDGGLDSSNIRRGRKTVTFTESSGGAVPVAHDLPTRPLSIWVSSLVESAGLTVPTAAWSVTPKMNQSNQIELFFQGLTNATKYVAVVEYE